VFGTRIAYYTSDALSFFPGCVKYRGERKKERTLMKILRNIAFGLALIVGLSSVSASAQKNDQKRPPKKPPVVTPQDKKPKEDKPKGDKGNRGRGGKKPGMASSSMLGPEKYA